MNRRTFLLASASLPLAGAALCEDVGEILGPEPFLYSMFSTREDIVLTYRLENSKYEQRDYFKLDGRTSFFDQGVPSIADVVNDLSFTSFPDQILLRDGRQYNFVKAVVGDKK